MMMNDVNLQKKKKNSAHHLYIFGFTFICPDHDCTACIVCLWAFTPLHLPDLNMADLAFKVMAAFSMSAERLVPLCVQ